MKFLFAVIYIFWFSNSFFLQKINSPIGDFIEEPSLKNATISFEIVAIKNDSVISFYQSQKSLIPASTMKLVTTATALDVLGHDFRFKTSLAYDGKIDSNGVLYGNIYIVGAGDPTLGSKYYTGQNFLKEWLNEIQRLGIKKIKGSVVADGSCYSDEFIPSTWTWGDIGNYYGAGVTGLSVYDNTVSLLFRSGQNVGDKTIITSMDPYVPYFQVKNEVTSDNIKSDQAYIFGAPYSQYRIARGSIPLNVSDFSVKASIYDPSFLIAFKLDVLLKENGIELTNPPTTIRKLKEKKLSISSNQIEFHEHYSDKLNTIINHTNLISNNHFAEHIHRAVGAELNKEALASAFSSSKLIKEYWINKEIKSSGFHMNDGSGLSRNNALTASFLVDVLCYMKNNSKAFPYFIESLPIAGKTGTLKYFGRGTILEGKLIAKSGSMQRIRSYAGYYKSNANDLLAFAVIVNNYNCTSAELKKLIEKLLVSELIKL